MVELFELYGTIKGDTSNFERSIDRSRTLAQKFLKDLTKFDKSYKSTVEINLTQNPATKINRQLSSLKLDDVKANLTVGKVSFPAAKELDLKTHATVVKVKFPPLKDLDLKVNARLGKVILPKETDLNLGGTRAPNGRGFNEADKAAAKAAQSINRYDVALAKLAGRQTELLKLNQILSQPGVASKIDQSTQATLRQKAALIDTQRAAQAAQKASGSGLGSFASSFGGNVAASAIFQLTGAFTGGGRAVLDYTAALEQARIGFTTLTGSVQNASQHILDLQNFAKKTPFDFAGLVKASQLLQGVGIQTEKVIPLLTDVGNRLAAAGKGNAEIERTVLALSQMASKGKLAGQEINQLAENGIPAATILAQAMGKTRAEVLELSEAGQISFDLFVAALKKTNEENKLGDQMEKQSHTFNGALSNINDSLFQFAEAAFRPLFTKFASIADELAKEINKDNAQFTDIGSAMGKAVGNAFGVAVLEAGRAAKNQLLKEISELYGQISNGDFSGLGGKSPISFGGDAAQNALKSNNQIAPLDKLSRESPLFAVASGGFFLDTARAEKRKAEEAQRAIEKAQKTASSFGAFAGQSLGINVEKITGDIKKVQEAARKIPSITDLLAGGDGKGGKKTGGSKANPFVEIQDFIKSAGFVPGSAQRPSGPNGPTDHAKRGAVDVSVRANPGKSVEDFTRLIIGALEKGKQVIDERIVGFHKGIKSTGPNVHIGNSPNRSFFLDQSKYSVPVDYLKELDAKRRNRKGLDVDTGQITKDFNEKQQRILEEISNAATKDFRDKILSRSLEAYRITGIIPSDELLNEAQRRLTEQAKKGKDIGLGLGVQPNVQETERILTQKRDERRPPLELTTTQSPILEQFNAPLPPTLDEDYLAKFREQLGIVEAIQEVIFKTANYEATVGLQAVSAIVNQRRDLQQAGIDFDTQAKLNADATFVAQRRQLSALTEINALQKEYADLQDESFNLGNKILNQDRQRNRVLSERNGLSREIQDLQSEIASGGANDALKVEAALLRDILELRNRELDATISINRSRLEINDKLTIHSDQIKARTLEVLASQKSITDIFSDAQTGAIEDAFSGVDSGVHALAKSLGIADTAAGRFFETMIAGLAKLALNKLFTKLFDPKGKLAGGGDDLFGEVLGIPTDIRGARGNGGGISETLKEQTETITESTSATVLLGASGERAAGALTKTSEGAALLQKEMARLAATCAKAAKDCGCDGEKKQESSGGGLFGKILGAVIGAAGSALGGAISGRAGGSIPVDGTGTPGPLLDDIARPSGDAGLSSVKKSFAQSTSASVQEKINSAGARPEQNKATAPVINQQITNHFHANKETGAFSKDSAFQVAKKTAGLLRDTSMRE